MGLCLMSAHKIVHITPTPLVGAPGKIAMAQCMKGHEAIAVTLSDYPKGGPLEKMFLSNTLIFDDFTKDYIEKAIVGADFVHVHNYLSQESVIWLKQLNQSATYIYQAHSPLREGPLYVNINNDINFRVSLVVGQHWGRFYPSYLPVPNLIISNPSLRLRQKGEKLRIMFSPTHKHVGRWTSKYSEKLLKVLAALSEIGKIDVISPEKAVRPETLIEIRRSCHVSIDEISTGGFHMVSLEAMCVGNIAINRADFFAKATFASFCDGELPPFQYADDGCIAELILKLADDWGLTARLQRESYDYFISYCNPLRLVEVFDAAYEIV